MCLKWKNQQLKIIIYVHTHTYIDIPHGNYKLKICRTCTNKHRKECIHNTKDSHQITGEKNKQKNYKNNPKTIN